MAIKVSNLDVKYKDIHAVKNVSFEVKDGEIFGMIGSNGAGKTTIIESIEGLRKKYDGSISVMGVDTKHERKKLYKTIGVQLQETSYQDKIRVKEIGKLFASFYTNPGDFDSLLRNFVALFFTIIFPPLLLLVFGEIYGNDPLPMFDGRGTMDVSVPAYICMIICVTGIMSLPLALAEYREKKILKRFEATPISPVQIIIAQIFVNLLMTVIGSLLLVILGKVLYDVSFEGDVLQVGLAFLLSIVNTFSIGFFVASFISNSKAATAVANVLYFPMLFLSGATIPVETMPDTIKKISRFIPLSYAVEIMKGTWHGDSLKAYGKEILILSVIAVICMVLSAICFRWESD